MKLIRQTEATECGLACLAMIANTHGHQMDLTTLREMGGVSLRGSTLAHLARLAQRLGFTPSGKAVDDLSKLSEVRLPAILHWDMNHFVVLADIKGSKALIFDPGRGRLWMDMAELSRHFSGPLLELQPADNLQPIIREQKLTLTSLLRGVSGVKSALVKVVLLSALFQIAVLLLPFFIQLVIDRAIPSGDMALVWALAIGFSGLVLVRAASEALRSWTVIKYGHIIAFQIIARALRHLLNLPVTYFDKRHVGDIISRMNSAQPVQHAITQDGVAVFVDALMVIVTLGIMLWINPVLTVIVGVSALLASAIALWLYPRIRESQEASIVARAQENSHTIETIRAATTLKLFDRADIRARSWGALYQDYLTSTVEYGRWVILQALSDRVIFGFQSVAVISLGAFILISGDGLTIGMLFAFLMFRQLFSDALSRVLFKGLELRLLGLHLERLADIYLAKVQNQSDTVRRLPDVPGDIVLDNVSFRYSESDPWVLKNVNLTLPAGKMSCLTGPSGGGKTTLLKLLLGLYQPSKGEIRIGDVPLRDISQKEWSQSIGVVMQDDALLSGTIAENISFFDPDPDMQRIIHCAKMAQISDDIAKLPMAYLSMIGDMGAALSGGQRQRVLLARSFYHNPKMLFLDEGTANLDKTTESEIAGLFSNLPQTRVIIAHRPAFSNFSDRIIHIDNGGARIEK